MDDLQKRQPIRSQKIRDAARGQRCCLNLPGICNYDPETTVLAHLHDESFGKGIKADDTSGVFACSSCHAAIDEHRHGLSKADLERSLRRAMQRTIRRLVVMEIITVPQDKPKTRKPRQRLPKDKRSAIQGRGFDKSHKRRMDGTVVDRITGEPV